MGFLTAARAVLLHQKFICGILAAAVLVCLAAFFVSCTSSGSGGLPHPLPGQNAYVTLPGTGNVLLLHIDGTTGEITPGTQTPQVAATSPNGLALLGSKFLYVANAAASSISIFSINSDGTLSLTGTPTLERGSGPYAAVIDPSGSYLLVTNSLSNDVSVFSIDSSTGALQEISGSPFYANDNPTEILIMPSGQFVYVSNPSIGMVTAFTFDSSSGVLTPIQGSPFISGAGASGLAIDGSESYLYVANTSAVNPGSASVGNISGFAINKTAGALFGALSPVAGSPFTSTVGSGPSALVVSQGNKFLYATTPGSSYSIWCFLINPNGNGQLTAVSSSPFSDAAGDLFALIDSEGNFFYIGDGQAPGVAGYTYDPNSGQPTAITNSPFTTGVAPGKMVIAH